MHSSMGRWQGSGWICKASCMHCRHNTGSTGIAAIEAIGYLAYRDSRSQIVAQLGSVCAVDRKAITRKTALSRSNRRLSALIVAPFAVARSVRPSPARR